MDAYEFFHLAGTGLMILSILFLLVPVIRSMLTPDNPPTHRREISVVSQPNDSFEDLVAFLVLELDNRADWKPSFQYEVTRLESKNYPIWLTFTRSEMRLFLGLDKLRFIELLSEANYLLTIDEKSELSLAAMDLVLHHQSAFLNDVRQSLPIM